MIVTPILIFWSCGELIHCTVQKRLTENKIIKLVIVTLLAIWGWVASYHWVMNEREHDLATNPDASYGIFFGDVVINIIWISIICMVSIVILRKR